MSVDQLPARVREFVNYLDGLLARLDQGGGWCGVFWQRDPDGMQACLDGREVPPWDVVEALLHDLAGQYGPGGAAPETERARALHAAALAAYDARPGGRDALGDRLDVMLREQRYAAERQAELGRALASATSQEEADAIRLDLAWARDDHERATARCAELRARTADLDRRAASVPRQAIRREGMGEGSAFRADDGFAADGFAADGFAADGFAADGFAADGFAADGSAGGGFAGQGFTGRGFAGDGFGDAGFGGAGLGDAGFASSASREEAAVRDAGAATDTTAAAGRAQSNETRAADRGPRAVPDQRDVRPAAVTTSWATDEQGQPVAEEQGRSDGRGTRQRKRRRGSARFAGIVEEEAAPVVVPPTAAPVLPTLPAQPVTGRRTPRGARFAGAEAEPVVAAPVEPRAERMDGADRREVVEVVQTLVRLRGEGRSGEAHALLVEAAYWPAVRIPLLAAEMQRAGLGADWASLLWEAASLPAERLVAAADALTAAGRADDGEQILRQGVGRPAHEIGQAVVALAGDGRHREVRALLDAYVRVRTPEEAARSAAADPKTLVPLLLAAAQGVSDECQWDLVHALRVAGHTA
ncbi:hypothetical protein [Streptomyces caeruleatus]|uniref:UL36 very large tegument protein n=1 Tax=Streptomyces caeruleatus TaxID=661399 RepID=A0A101U8D6_9ACTN|nr:hypothetical protein [Streptomyces caeruleatus]KUO06018.1 hypothetical protein AQJ67_04235 [Streptomyces caeruleatus]